RHLNSVVGVSCSTLMGLAVSKYGSANILADAYEVKRPDRASRHPCRKVGRAGGTQTASSPPSARWITTVAARGRTVLPAGAAWVASSLWGQFPGCWMLTNIVRWSGV